MTLRSSNPLRSRSNLMISTAPTFAWTATNRLRSTTRRRVTTDKSMEALRKIAVQKFEMREIVKNNDRKVNEQQQVTLSGNPATSDGLPTSDNGHEPNKQSGGW